jgi:negative regulator of sigma E activity
MVIQINVKNPDNLKKGDLLVFDGEKFDVITKDDIVSELKKEVELLRQEVESSVLVVKNTKNAIKLRQHRFLKAFVKGE